MLQQSQYQRYVNFLNHLGPGATYSSDSLYEAVGRFEQSTWWKRYNKQRHYTTSSYQCNFLKLGAIERVGRGQYRVLYRVPDWFKSKHLKFHIWKSSYERDINKLLAQKKIATDPDEIRILDTLIKTKIVPDDQQHNPFVNTIKKDDSDTVKVSLESVLEYYKLACTDWRIKIERHVRLLNSISVDHYVGNINNGPKFSKPEWCDKKRAYVINLTKESSLYFESIDGGGYRVRKFETVLNIKKDFLVTAYKQVLTQSAEPTMLKIKEMLEAQFPSVVEPDYYNFGLYKPHSITTYAYNQPIAINDAIDTSLSGKAILLNKTDFDVEIKDTGYYYLVTFKKNK